MCFFFHRWTTWEEPERHNYRENGIVVEARFTQSRTCKKCKKVETRTIGWL